jgi:hypothetical protein
MDMMREAIEQRASQTLIAEDARPFLEWKIGCYDRRPMFVTLERSGALAGLNLRERIAGGPSSC